MLNSRRSLTAAAFGALLLTPLATSAVAQETNTVGPPVLEDFQLPGQRTTPPATQPQPQPQPPVATPPTQTEPRTTAPVPNTQRTEPRSTAPAPATKAPAPAPGREPAAPPAPAEAAPASQQPAPQTLQPPVPTPAPVLNEAAPAAEAPRDWTWLYYAVPAALVLLALFALIRRRRRATAEAETYDYETVPAAEPEPEAPAAPVGTVPEPEPEPAVLAPATEDEARAWLEIELTPDRAAATDTEAVVHYELILRNIGSVPAANIRIDTKLFNASDEAEMNDFFTGPIHEVSGSPQIRIDPGNGLFLVGQVAMPKDSVREVRWQDRSLFIPMIAMNVAYDWEGPDGQKAGTGRTSKSWLVGRQPREPQAKMGAFRLDQGPRIYRGLEGRQAKLVKV